VHSAHEKASCVRVHHAYRLTSGGPTKNATSQVSPQMPLFRCWTTVVVLREGSLSNPMLELPRCNNTIVTWYCRVAPHRPSQKLVLFFRMVQRVEPTRMYATVAPRTRHAAPSRSSSLHHRLVEIICKSRPQLTHSQATSCRNTLQIVQRLRAQLTPNTLANESTSNLLYLLYLQRTRRPSWQTWTPSTMANEPATFVPAADARWPCLAQ